MVYFRESGFEVYESRVQFPVANEVQANYAGKYENIIHAAASRPESGLRLTKQTIDFVIILHSMSQDLGT